MKDEDIRRAVATVVRANQSGLLTNYDQMALLASFVPVWRVEVRAYDVRRRHTWLVADPTADGAMNTVAEWYKQHTGSSDWAQRRLDAKERWFANRLACVAQAPWILA